MVGQVKTTYLWSDYVIGDSFLDTVSEASKKVDVLFKWKV